MNLKILKLRSGEEIACQVLEENESNIKIFQPMIFKILSSFDNEGNPCDVTTLHDWLMNTDEKNISLPMSHIAFIVEPSKETKKLYELESVKEFDQDNFKTTIQETNSKSMESDIPDMKMLEMFLAQILNDASWADDKTNKQSSPQPQRRKRKPKKNYLPPDMTSEEELDRHMIMMQLYIPAEAIMNLVTSGVIDPKTLLDMVKEVKKRNRFTGDEKNRQDFGNKLSDWNPDPKSDDYN